MPFRMAQITHGLTDRMIFLNISDRFKLVKIRLERHLDIKRFIKNILETCSLSTEKIDEIKITKDSANSNRRPASAEEYHARDASIFEEYEVYWQSSQKAKQEKTLEYVQLAFICFQRLITKNKFFLCDTENGF